MDPHITAPPTAPTSEPVIRSISIDNIFPASSSSSPNSLSSLSSPDIHNNATSSDVKDLQESQQQLQQNQRRSPPLQITTPHVDPLSEGNNVYQPPPITPGADKITFDRGLLFAGRPSWDAVTSNQIVSAPIPTHPPIFSRNNSYPEPSTYANRNEKGNSNNDRNPDAQNHPIDMITRPHNHHMPEVRSAPIHMPSSSNTRPLSPQHRQNQKDPQQQQHFDNTNNGDSSGGRPPYTLHSTPAALRPDSVCSFPDSSPVMSPTVLAAVDARLRASASNSSLREPPPLLRQGAFPTAKSGSKTSSLAPVITHHQVLQSSESITSREQLFDMLNKDDDDDNDSKRKDSGDTETTGHFLRTPRPGFANGSSARSSRRNSAASSTVAADSDIELVTKARSSLSGNRNGRSALGKSAMTATLGADTGESKNAPYEKTLQHEIDTFVSMKTEKSAWLKNKSSATRKYRGLCCAVGILVFIGVVVGITLGFISRKDKVDGLAPPPNPDKPDKPPIPPITHFTPDPNLRKAFYGVDYNPEKVMMPWCGATLQPIINDMILISQITNRVRLYGMDCNQADLTFQAINALGLNKTMQVVLTIWVDKNQTTYQRQHDTLFQVLDTYGTDMVNGISIGNEVLFRNERTLSELASLMKAIKAEIKSRYGKSIPVFSSDVGVKMTPELAAVSDVLQGNIHPYFSGTPAENAGNWTLSEYENKIAGNPTPAGIKGVISEVGWPSAPASAVYLNGSIPGLANMQMVVDNFVCQANAAGIPYYWFEFKDEPWKNDPAVPVEPHWGIFDKDGKLKIKIPDCISP